MEKLECALEKLQIYAVRRRPCQVSGMGLRFLIVQSGEVVVRCANHRQTVRAGTLMRVAREAVIQPGQGEYTELQLGLPDALLQERLGRSFLCGTWMMKRSAGSTRCCPCAPCVTTERLSAIC